MSVDIKQLSSKELFELAKQKEKEEQEASQRATRLTQVKEQKAKLIAKHEEALAAADTAIKELQEKRTRMVTEFKASLAPLELDIQELERQVMADKARADAQPSKPKAQAPAPVKAPTPSAPVLKPASSGSPPPAAIQKPETADPQAAKQTPPNQEVDSSDELIANIRHIMRSRTYISESLLKEKLKASGFDTSDLKKEMDKLIREGRLEKKGSGNFALGKRK